MVKVKIKDLRLGDRISLFDGAYGSATVCNVKADIVEVIRPYIHTADFTYTGGVITYIGQELVKLWIGDTREVVMLSSQASRGELK